MNLGRTLTAWLACAVLAFASNTGRSQTPNRDVSGAGAQVIAHGVDPSGEMLDVQVLFNAAAQTGANGEVGSGAIAVLLTETSGKFETKTFGSIPSSCLEYWYSPDGELHLTAKVTLVGTGSTLPTDTHEAELKLDWKASTAAQQVSGSSSYTQPGHSITEQLSGALQQTQVSGSIRVDSFSVPLAASAGTYWTTSNQRVDQICSPNCSSPTDKAKSRITTPEASSSSASGYWTGYWTWDAATETWYWTWVWVWTNGSGAAVES